MKVNYTYDGEYVQCLTDHLSSFTMVVLSDEGGEEEAMVNMLTKKIFTRIALFLLITSQYLLTKEPLPECL